MEKFLINKSLIKKMGKESLIIVKKKYDVDFVNHTILKELL